MTKDLAGEKPVSALLDDLEFLQDLLDEELAEMDIPILDEVVEPSGKLALVAGKLQLGNATMELDFDNFELDDALLSDGLGLDIGGMAPASQATTVIQSTTIEAPAAAAAGDQPDITKPSSNTVTEPVAVDASSATAPTQPVSEPVDREALVAQLVDQCLREAETLLRPRLAQLCRELLAGTHKAP